MIKVTLLAVVTIDGKLGRSAHHLSNWSSPEDKKIFVALTKRAGVIIMGNNTYKTLPSPLPGRLHIVMTRHLEGKQDMPGSVEFSDRPPENVLSALEERGYSEAILGGGSQINALFLQHGLVDEISLTIEPLIFGMGIDLFSGVQFDIRARLLEIERLNDDGTLRLRYNLR